MTYDRPPVIRTMVPKGLQELAQVVVQCVRPGSRSLALNCFSA